MEPIKENLLDPAAESSDSMPNKWRRRAGRLAILLATLVLLFMTIEIGFRIATGIKDAGLEHRVDQGKTWAIYDAQLGYRPRPTDDNPLGLRSPSLGDKIPGRLRLLFLGDSIPHGGDSIDDTLVTFAQKALAQSGHQTELINAGIPGYTTYQELGFLKKFGLDLSPDIVAVGFCVNDLHKFLHTFKVKDGQIVGNKWDISEDAAKTAHGTLSMIARKSMFLRWIRGLLRKVEKRARFTVGGGFLFDHRSDLATAWQDEPWIEYAKYLDEIISLGQSHNFRVVVVAFPFAAQYREDYLSQDRDYVLKPQIRLDQVCSARGVPLLDLYDALNPKEHISADGIHFSATGRKEVGLQIARFLIEEGLIP